MNHLQHETSPYLLQHAHNPVDWYAWKPEAFDRARAENKPILVSIGYSTCHWCHVMERESFEDPAVAAIMNEHFINIKVDREERPDVDNIYMEACVILSGSGGWPLNCFLLPDGRPFLAGTYYPPVPAFNRPSWSQLLQHIAGVFRDRRTEVEEQANRLVDTIANSSNYFLGKKEQLLPGQNPLNPVVLHNAYQNLKRNFDRENGGFGGAPKFPGAMALQFLLEYNYYTGEQEALDHVVFSLDRMVRGGIYDQLGGGFARYATDAGWLVPHFEKMLYDNALLIGLLADVWKKTHRPLFKKALVESLAWVEREMTGPQGEFYSALDADSEGVEGKFYVWDAAEIAAQAPDAETAALFSAFYDVSPTGNWEGHNILWSPVPIEQFALEMGQSPAQVEARLAPLREKLFQKRATRIRPGLDDKVLLSWNALMCTAYARAYTALGEEKYRQTAVRNLEFMLNKFRKGDSSAFFHTYKYVAGKDQVQYDAFLDDYAYLIEALLQVFSITQEKRYLSLASDLCAHTIANFLDWERNLFYFTSQSQNDLVLRKIELYDNALPAGNSTMAMNLRQLGLLLGNAEYTTLAAALLGEMIEGIERYPSSFARWANALLYMAYPGREIALLGPAAENWREALQSHFLPNTVWMSAPKADENYPLLAGKGDHDGIFICRDYACDLPFAKLEEAMEKLGIEE